MSLTWMRVARNITKDKDTHRGAEIAGVDVHKYAGHLLDLWNEMFDQAEDGNLAIIPDSAIEQYANWRGKKGAFAKAVRATLCHDEHHEQPMVMRSWDRFNGAAIREARADMKRKKEGREKSAKERAETKAHEENTQRGGRTSGRKSADRPPDIYRTSTGSPTDVPRMSEGCPPLDVDGDELQLTTNNKQPPPDKPALSVSKREKPEPKFPHFPVDLCADMHAMWCEARGGVKLPMFRALFGPIFVRAESERPPDAPTNAELKSALKSVLDLGSGGSGAPFLTVANVAARLSAVAKVRREFAHDPTGRVAAVERLLHTRIAS